MSLLLKLRKQDLALRTRPGLPPRLPCQAKHILIRPRLTKQRAATPYTSVLQALSGAEGLSTTEAAALEAELAALDTSIGAKQAELEQAEKAIFTKERDIQTKYEAEIASLTKEIHAQKQQQQDAQDAEESEEVQRMLAKVENLKADAATMTLTLTERKDEIEGLKRQLAEFEQSSEPVRAFALVGLREREADASGVATIASPPNWANDWGSFKLPRMPDSPPAAPRPMPQAPGAAAISLQIARTQDGQDVMRKAGVPGLLLAAGGMAIGRVWKTLQAAVPPEGRFWMDVAAASLMIGTVAYASLSR